MHTQKHCHFVAFPLTLVAALLVAVMHSSVSAVVATGESVHSVRLGAEDATLDAGLGPSTALTLEPGAVLLASQDGTSVQMKRGEAVLKTSELLSLTARGIRAGVQDGAVAVLIDDTSVVIAALTAPVVLDDGTERALLAPGMQYIHQNGKGKTADLPPEWLRLKLEKAKNLVQEAGIRGRVTEQSLSDLLSPADVLLRDATLARLLSEGSRTNAAAGQEIAREIESDAWFREALAPLLPRMVLSRGPAAEAVIDAWAGWIVQHGFAETEQALSALETAASIPGVMNSRGYPKQAQLWQRAVLHAAQLLRPAVSEDKRSTIDDIVMLASHDVTPEEEVLIATADVPTTNWTADELIGRAHDMAVSHGAMMATTTVFTADETSQTVRVTGIFVAEDTGDISYDFTYSPGRGLLTQIVREGQPMPNSLTPEAFFQ